MCTIHIRRILSLLGSPIPHTNGFQKYDNPFNANAYYKVCNLYGVNPAYAWMTGKWMYSTQGLFTHGGKQANEYTQFSNDYSSLDNVDIRWANKKLVLKNLVNLYELMPIVYCLHRAMLDHPS